MIRELTAVLFLISNSALCINVDSIEEQFKHWQIENAKSYASFEELMSRYEVFTNNIRIIEELNDQHRHYGTVFKANRFADISLEEFSKKYLLPKRKPVAFPSSNEYVSQQFVGIPQSFDWRDKNVVTPVRDQGSAGTCWAFSAVQNIESQWALKGRNITEFSVEQVVDCDGTEDVAKRKANCGVFGGWPYLAYQYVQREGGLTSEIDYPYCCGLGGDKGTCYVCPPPGYNKTLCGPPSEYCQEADSCHAKLDRSKFVEGLNVKGWTWFNDNETEISQHLAASGPLSVAMNAATLQFYHSGIYDPLVCDPTALDHAVLLVGYGVETTVLGRKKQFWTVKNSWGSGWGEKGYFRIAKGKGKCGINTQVTTSHLK